ncbi:selenium cofactor biosynthesis protein YqeC [Enterocloster citroniae]|uniref:selenium cofactor biosynthesis protein YqeC n=1 Tax=Enterocloster citroniae TaxID=358743 RepID=UPI00349EF1F3
MYVYSYKRKEWGCPAGLWDGLGLEEQMGKKGTLPYVMAVTGAGGKTSFIRRLAWEGASLGRRVLVTTTTHMARPEHLGVFTQQVRDVKSMLDRESVAVAGRLTGEGKISSLEPDFYESICPEADLVLVEADGSKRLPLKVPRPGEPVIPGNTDMILCVSGLTALGFPAADRCCRLDFALEIMEEHGRRDYMDGGQWIIGPEDLGCLMLHGYLNPLRSRYMGIPVIPVFNQADTLKLAEVSLRLLREMNEDLGIALGGLHQDVSASLF